MTDNLGTHVSSFDEDDDGWTVVNCSCGASSGPLPDMETAADMWGEHYAEVAVQAIVTRYHTALDIIRRFLDGWEPDEPCIGPPVLCWFQENNDEPEPVTPEERAVLDQAKDQDHS